jgi:aquaporin Z
MSLRKRTVAECLGTFWLVFGGWEARYFLPHSLNWESGFTGVALAFGLTVLTMAYAIRHISGAHLNPAVSIGLAAGKRFSRTELLPYIVAQVIGAVLAAGVLYLIASGKEGFSPSGGFASNGYAAHSPAVIHYFRASSRKSC